MDLRGVLVAFVLALTAVSTNAEPAAGPLPRTAIILCEGLHASDIGSMSLPSLRELARRGSIGLMTMPPTIAASPETAVLSMAVGGPARGKPEDRAAYRPDEAVEGSSPEVVLERRTGHRVSTDRGRRIVHVGIASLARRGLADRLLSARRQQGTAGARIGVHMPSDLTQSDVRRLAALFACDTDGLAANADHDRTEITILSVGDDLKALDRHLTQAAAAADRVWVLAYRPAAVDPGSYLSRPTLTLLVGRGVPVGLLTSATTRTAGLISYVDIAPTLLHWMRRQGDARDAGHAVEVIADAQSLSAVDALDRTMVTHQAALVPVLMAFGTYAGLVMLAALASVRLWPRIIGIARALVYSAMPIPIAFMATGPIARAAAEPVPSPVLAASIALLSAAMALVCWLWSRHRSCGMGVAMIRSVTFLTVCIILADAWTGQRLMKGSIVTAAGTAGARFYGIGNEYMGFLVASAAGLALVGKLPRWAAILLFALVVVSLGLGHVGANAGGVVTAVTAFAIALANPGRRRQGWLWAIVGAALGVMAAIGFAALDRALSGHQPSHLGATLGRSSEGGLAIFVALAMRKLSMSVGAASSPHGVFALAAGTLVFSAAYAWMRRDIAGIASRYPEWWLWRWPATVGAITALVANDTGIVPMLIVFGSFVYAGMLLRLSMPVGEPDPPPWSRP